MIFFAEVIRSFPPDSEFNINKLRYEYQVRCTINGSILMFNNAIMLEPLSGVDNFHEVILRSSFDDSGAGGALFVDQAEGEFRPGDRVLITFPDQNYTSPVILGTLPHPTFEPATNEKEEKLESLPILAKAKKPQIRGRYNGFHYRIDEIGQTRLQHTGAAEIKIEDGQFVEAIDEAASSITTMDFLKKGSFRLVDSNKQGFTIDAVNKSIVIGNTLTFPDDKFDDIKEIEIAEPFNEQVPKGQAIKLDQKKQDLSILSSKTHKLIVGTDQTIKVFGNSDSKIFKNETRETQGDFQETIGKNSTINVGDSLITNVKKNIAFISDAGNSIFLDAAKGKEAIFISHKTGAQIIMDKNGTIKILASDGTSMFLNAETGEITMITSNGALITAKENVVISDAAGTELITMKQNAIEINAATSVTVSATNVTLNGGAVSLGAGATLSAVLGEPLVAWLNTHSHASVFGPVSPPIVPAPPTILSQSVKVKL